MAAPIRVDMGENLPDQKAQQDNLIDTGEVFRGQVRHRGVDESGSPRMTERDAVEMVGQDEPGTPFMSFGDSILTEVRSPHGGALYGAIDQRLVRS